MEDVPRMTRAEELEALCPGLMLVQNFLSEVEEAEMLTEIDTGNIWDDRLSRRVQHYGYEFDYASRKVIADHPMIPFPSKTQAALDKVAAKVAPEAREMNQLTINEYLPGQGISAHIDTHSCFGDVMLSISLAGDILMRFIPASSKLNSQDRISFWLPRRSLLVMSGASRFAFKHAIPLRKTDSVDGVIIPRVRRVSLTFRSVRLPAVCHCPYPDACDSQELELEPTRIAVRPPLAIFDDRLSGIVSS